MKMSFYSLYHAHSQLIPLIIIISSAMLISGRLHLRYLHTQEFICAFSENNIVK